MRFVLGVAIGISGSACGLLFPLDEYGPPSGGMSPGTTEAGDASTEGVARDASTERFCLVAPHAFCADFDNGGLREGWTGEQIDPPGSLSLSTTRSTSPPTAFVAMMPRRPTKLARAALQKTFPGPFRRMVVEFDTYLDPPDWASDGSDINGSLIDITFSSNTNSKALYIIVGKDYSRVGSETRSPLPTGTWLHVTMDVDPTNEVNVVVGTEHYRSAFAAPSAGALETLISLGVIGFNAPAPLFQVYYDNVSVDFP